MWTLIVNLGEWGIVQKLGCRTSLAKAGSGLRFLFVALFALAIASCATPNQYMGISLLPAAAEPELQQLAQRARIGDKQAQLQLGIAFEEGHGVERDLSKARILYQASAMDSGGSVWVYMPPVGNGTAGRTVSVSRGPRQTGLADAQARLDSLTDYSKKN